jgi:hypothetical protein
MRAYESFGSQTRATFTLNTQLWGIDKSTIRVHHVNILEDDVLDVIDLNGSCFMTNFTPFQVKTFLITHTNE